MKKPVHQLDVVALAVALVILLALTVRPATAQQVTLPAEAGHSLGDADAPLHVIEFSDFGCRFCRMFALQTFPAIAQEFIKSGRVRWTFVTIRLVGYRSADAAAQAAECAAQQDAFWAMHEQLFAEPEAWSSDPAETLEGYARAIGLDVSQFRRCIESREVRDKIRRNSSIARQARIPGTPTFFMNGRRVVGALPYDQFRAVLLEEEGT